MDSPLANLATGINKATKNSARLDKLVISACGRKLVNSTLSVNGRTLEKILKGVRFHRTESLFVGWCGVAKRTFPCLGRYASGKVNPAGIISKLKQLIVVKGGTRWS